MADKIKVILAVLVTVGALAAFYYFQDQSTLIRTIGLLVALGVVIAIMLQTAIGRGALAFVHESQLEVRKVVWPTRKETFQTTGLVMAMVVVIALFLWGLDAVLIWAVKSLTGQGA